MDLEEWWLERGLRLSRSLWWPLSSRSEFSRRVMFGDPCAMDTEIPFNQ